MIFCHKARSLYVLSVVSIYTPHDTVWMKFIPEKIL